MRQWYIKKFNGIVLNADNTPRHRSLPVRIAFIAGMWAGLRVIDVLYFASIPFLALFIFLAECFAGFVGAVSGIRTALGTIYRNNVRDIQALSRVARNTHGVGTINKKIPG